MENSTTMFTPFTCQSTVCICRTPGVGWENLRNFLGEDVVQEQACIARVSLRLWSKELEMRVKDSAKNGASKRVGSGGWRRKEGKATDKSRNFETTHFSCLSAHTDI